MSLLGFEDSQLLRPARTFELDRRRTCDNVSCFNIEIGNSKFGKCARCKRLAYCSKSCQKQDWKMHKSECRSAEVISSDERLKEENRDSDASEAGAAAAPK